MGVNEPMEMHRPISSSAAEECQGFIGKYFLSHILVQYELAVVKMLVSWDDVEVNTKD